jgi:cysteinyl-tRNA synthetase
MTHYREPIDFSVKRLEEAEQKLRDWQRASKPKPGTPPEPSVVAELADDLNFHRASVALDVVARKANRGTETAANCLAATLEFLGFTTDGLLTAATDAPAGVEAAVANRLAALNAKDFAKADTIRAQLLTQGVQLMDYKDEAGQRQTKWEVVR